MGSRRETADFLLEQLEGRGITLRRMFGEYAVQRDGKTLGFICDDTLFVRQEPAITAYLGTPTPGHPYPGSKPYWQIDPDQWEERDWLVALFELIDATLPAPKPKSPRRKPKA